MANASWRGERIPAPQRPARTLGWSVQPRAGSWTFGKAAPRWSSRSGAGWRCPPTQLPAALPETARTRHRRLRAQGSLDRAELDAILGAGFMCHFGVVVDGHPMVVPTVYGSDGRNLYFHGPVASRSLVASPEATVCVTVTHVDGLVLARSVFEHGVSYRSAMIYGVPRLVTDEAEKLEGCAA